MPLAIRRERHELLFALLLLAAMAGIASCSGAGGGSGGGTAPSNPNNTPARTYSVVVTATSGGVSHKATLTLTVD